MRLITRETPVTKAIINSYHGIEGSCDTILELDVKTIGALADTLRASEITLDLSKSDINVCLDVECEDTVFFVSLRNETSDVCDEHFSTEICADVVIDSVLIGKDLVSEANDARLRANAMSTSLNDFYVAHKTELIEAL